ncbi:MAG: MFS transporter [Bacteroidota bacterium]|nr:MFS transporter [Bacteroidota bacterium]MDP4231074.1 MFS transporter [Bacteroidota bacterium]MDP4236241.1 MFS transporter [Bacteroidota bacterium]
MSEDPKGETPKLSQSKKLPPNVIWLGIASLFNDMSSEILLRALPLYLTGALGVSTSIIGLIEGVAETTSSLLKVVFGWFSDKWRSRKNLAVSGYFLSAIAKPILLFTTSWLLPFVFRVIDRIGKGVRTAPRDALIADSVTPELRGRAYGFNRALDPLGAMLGSLIAAGVLYGIGGFDKDPSAGLDSGVFRTFVIIAAIPTFLAVLLIVFFVHEKKKHARDAAAPVKISFTGMGRSFNIYLVILFVFSLGLSSDAFLLLRAKTVGISTAEIFLMITFFNLVTAVSAYPAGVLSDKLSRRTIILIGWIYYAVLYIGFAYAETSLHIWILYVSYGLYYGLTEGVEKAFVADLVPKESRGTAFGLFNGVIGIAALPASLVAGILWQSYGDHAPFLFGGGLALLASIMMLFFRAKKFEIHK